MIPFPFKPPPPPERDPRSCPAAGDRIYSREEGADRIVLSVTDNVTWRYAGQKRERTSSKLEWHSETAAFTVVRRS